MITIPTILINLISPFVVGFVPSKLPPLILEPLPKQPTVDDINEHLSSNKQEEVLASWYGAGFHGRLTANGEVFDQYDLTAASPHLPFGTRLLVTYNGRSTIVRINDRGPYSGSRGLDLSKAAATEIGLIDKGVDYITIARLD